MTFPERLVELRTENGYGSRKAFAEAIDIPVTTLKHYEDGDREPGHTFLKQVSEFFNVSIDYLLGVTDRKEVLRSFRVSIEEQTMVEKYRSLDAHGKDLVSTILEKEFTRCQESTPRKHLYTYYHRIACAGDGFLFDDIPPEIIEAPECQGADFIIGVNGDSMEPTLSDGDLVYVRRTDTIKTGAIGIFTIRNECYVKELGETGLVSHNPDYPEIPGDETVRCIGEVIGKVEGERK